MYATQIEIHRDELDRKTSLIAKDAKDNIVQSLVYLYNSNRDIHQEIQVWGKSAAISNYQYEYDKYNNKTKKFYKYYSMGNSKDNTFNYHESESQFFYTNEYDDDRLTKKTCFRDGVKIYENLYFYKENKLVRKERYSCLRESPLWLTDKYSYSGNKAYKIVYLDNGIVSYYNILEFNGDKVVKNTFRNPAKSKYHWSIETYENDYCDIFVSENYLSADNLFEILDYVNKMRPKNAKRLSTIISTSEVMADMEEDEIRKVLHDFEELGVHVNFDP
ncbi:MAG: hypothetical protein LBM16_05650 [Clostridiales bacterium]|jgi:hypothetical protein|nr:hypothetical protein [Clostridiales bacterium]